MTVSCFAAGCKNQGAGNDPFMQRRIIAPPPAASYVPPSVQMPGATGVPPLQPVPGPLGANGQWAPAASAATGGEIRPASATLDMSTGGSTGGDATSRSTDGWVPADKPTAAPLDHSAAQPANAPQSEELAASAFAAASGSPSDSLDWAMPSRVGR